MKIFPQVWVSRFADGDRDKIIRQEYIGIFGGPDEGGLAAP